MIRNKLRLFISMIILFIFIQSCEDNSIESGNNTFTVVEGDQIFIKDHKQKKWNITFAVNELGFDPDKFRHGLGVNTIPPILNPQFLNPGDQDYPPISDALVIGYTSQGIVRAYPLGILAHHEVANDFYNHIPVAAAY